jgi:hypothetical protein
METIVKTYNENHCQHEEIRDNGNDARPRAYVY